MKISVASGKGGTGKTTIATNLAVVIARKGVDVTYLDCDVEEPNGHIFLKPEINNQIDVTTPVPKVDFDKCTFCGDCSVACQYHAIAVFGETVEIFPELCHGSGGCSDVCPEDAITEYPRTIGQINSGIGMGVKFHEGRLNVGEALSPPVTKALKEFADASEVTILDAPPGTSCPVIEAISETDFVLLVTEPTPFGLNDLKLAVEMLREIGLPYAVIINRSDIGDSKTEEYCQEEKIDILMRIPYSRKIAEAYSDGNMMLEIDSHYEDDLYKLYQNMANRIQKSK